MLKALPLAERVAVDGRLRKKRSPEEVRERIERFRNRMLNRERVSAEDEIARLRQRRELTAQFEEELALLDLDEEEHERELTRFEEAFDSEDQDGNASANGFKQV